jgi:hypothetical protein
MKKVLVLSLAATAALMAGGDIAPVEPAATAETTAPSSEFLIFSNIKAKGEIRPRYEYVDMDGLDETANAFTNRLMLGIGADLFQSSGLSVYLEAVNVVGNDDFFDTTSDDLSDKGVYPVVADPDQTRITQAYVDWKAGDTLLRVGRQGVNLDNQRFIGTVNWRQMPQTYDAVALVNNSVENLNLLAAYVWQVNRILAKDSMPILDSDRGDQFDTGSVLLHASYTFSEALTLTGYGYLIQDLHDTWGIAATGKFNFEGGNLAYRAEYAVQTDPSFDDVLTDPTADADYYNLEANLFMNGFIAGAQYEVLGAGDDGNAPFSTPLATLHAHNGWADMFLATPADGLVDVNFKLGYKAKGFGVAKVIYHDFSSDRGDTDYGTEIDVLYKNKIPGLKGVTGLLKAAFYSADDYKVDTNKFWAMLDYKF